MAPIKTVLTWTSAFLLSVALGAPIDPSGMNKANGADMVSARNVPIDTKLMELMRDEPGLQRDT